MTHTLWVDGLSPESQLLDERLKFYWELESFGVTDSEHSVYDDFDSTIQLVDGRYKVQLPSKDGHPALPSNYNLCVKHLQGLMR